MDKDHILSNCLMKKGKERATNSANNTIPLKKKRGRRNTRTNKTGARWDKKMGLSDSVQIHDLFTH